MSQVIPTSIARRETEPGRPPAIEIVWSDGTTASYSPRLLRDACPCATCRERRADPAPAPLLQVLAPEETQPLAVAGMRPVGQYAYAISFSDGHDSGIYTLDYLRELA
ncbi:MAG: hypothetical protein RLZZ440_2630 [Planctomycetota bacterium]|jgi:DUF971 family protein